MTRLGLATIIVALTTATAPAGVQTVHPDAQWFPDAAFGLFLH